MVEFLVEIWDHEGLYDWDGDQHEPAILYTKKMLYLCKFYQTLVYSEEQRRKQKEKTSLSISIVILLIDIFLTPFLTCICPSIN